MNMSLYLHVRIYVYHIFICTMYLCVLLICLVSTEARRRHLISWNVVTGNSDLSHHMIGTELGFSTKAKSALSHLFSFLEWTY